MTDKKKNLKDLVARGATLSSTNRNWKADAEKRRHRKNIDSTTMELPVKRISDPENLIRIKKFLTTSGIKIGYYKDKYIARRIKVRMGRIGLQTYQDYLSYINQNRHELTLLKEALSINVTRFFRNKDTYELLKKDIFAQMLRTHSALKIWSAGCAVGAEPYSLSMIFEDLQSTYSKKVSITATDVNEELLMIARHGVYSEPYLTEMSDLDRRRYFEILPDGNYKVKSSIKSKVKFIKQDLIKDSYPQGFDIIVCRNVLIYIDKVAQKEIINKFIDSLNPNGILILGRTETLLGAMKSRVKIVSGVHRIYQKISGASDNVVIAPILQPQHKNIKDSFERLKRTSKVARSPKYQIEQHEQKKRKQHIKKIENQLPPSKSRSHIEKEAYERVQKRLADLKDFRKRFEQKKKLWEDRLDKRVPQTDSFGALSRAASNDKKDSKKSRY